MSPYSHVRKSKPGAVFVLMANRTYQMPRHHRHMRPRLLLPLLALPRRPAIASHGEDRLLLVFVARGCRCCRLAVYLAHNVYPLGGRCRRRRGGRHLSSKQGATQKRSHGQGCVHITRC